MTHHPRRTAALAALAISVKMLDLLKPIYRPTASYGYFGREEPGFSWERTDKVEALRDAAGLKAREAAAG